MQDLRRNYTIGSLSRDQLTNDPMDLFRIWWKEVETTPMPDWYEINAMTLSTLSDQAGAPARVCSRIVLLKHLDHGFCFFTNYDSDKAKQIDSNPAAALNFFWPYLERQVRVEGIVSKTASEMSDGYFASRPRASQIGAVVSPQSQVIAEEHDLVAKLEDLDKRLADKPIPRPENWGGFRLVPLLMEFWQGRPSRLHDRFRYRRSDVSSNHWVRERLAP